jgi:CIC family chloride channel protein
MFKSELYNKVKVEDIMIVLKENSIVDISKDSMEDAVNKFVASKNYNLPVVKDGKYLGFVSRANTLTSYRKTIHGMMQEQ